ncbi:hypothetical protein [Dinghuibacter silviterrae]|uniref:Uncharacterized protein n=1 Tax=Dinghuibacter silviterrae TaxID=1539049 RepID=A0A4R8DP76_9BACT|nr:hypothetical protein [Dinghuibacter silviterrae]TDW99096.1 hypothetical protein EDB95_0104 [Dinghuibacter silviterrae]
MNPIKQFFARLFGQDRVEKQDPARAQPVIVPNRTGINVLMAGREKERMERIATGERELKDWIVKRVSDKTSLVFSWESGGDEAFVHFDDDITEEDVSEDLEEYIVNKLDIPDAGEFKMNGNGVIYIADNFVRAKYSSTMKEIIDYNEDTDEEVFGEVEVDSNDIALFAL